MDLLTRAVSTGQFRNLLDVVQRAQEVCSMCGVRHEDLLMCPCRQAFYCSTACQLQHWKVHKQQCTEAQRGPAKLRACFCCGKASFNLFLCRCGIAVYCNVTCQRRHWGRHRNVCSTCDPPRSKREGISGRLRKCDKVTQTDPLMFTNAADHEPPSRHGDRSSDPTEYARYGNPLSAAAAGFGGNSLPEPCEFARLGPATALTPRGRSYSGENSEASSYNSVGDLVGGGGGSRLVQVNQTAVVPGHGGGGAEDAVVGWSGRRRDTLVNFSLGPDSTNTPTNPLDPAAAAAAAFASQSLRSATQGANASSESRSSFRLGAAPRATALVRQGTVLQSVMSSTEAHIARSMHRRSVSDTDGGRGGGGGGDDDDDEIDKLGEMSWVEKAAAPSFAAHVPQRRRTVTTLQSLLRHVLLDEESERASIAQQQRDIRDELMTLSSRACLKIASTELGEKEAKGRLEVLTNFHLWVIRQARSALRKLQRLAADGSRNIGIQR